MPDLSQPVISVIMGVYNGERYLRAALDSILAQTFTDFECIVVNDASTDSTQVILEGYHDSRLICLCNPENLGLTQSLNKGLAVAKGEFVARHDADDVSVLERFAAQVAYLQAHPTVGLLGTAYYMVDGEDNVLDTVVLPTQNDALQAQLIQKNILCHGTVMMQRDLLTQVGGYREQFRVTQDYDLWLRLAERTEMATLDTPLYLFRLDGKSISRQKRGLQLAYRNLAQEMAVQRRAGRPEPPFPADVMQAFPPPPASLLRDARANTFLHFTAGQEHIAQETLHTAVAMTSQTEGEVPPWTEWAFGDALRVAALRQDDMAGAAFIRWVFGELPMPEAARWQQQTLGRYFVDRAYAAYADGRNPFPFLRQAVAADKSWLGHRRLWAILLKSWNR